MSEPLRILGLITGMGPLMTAMKTSWEAFDAYGTVPAGERATVHLPKGPISISFATSEKTSRGVEADVPEITDIHGKVPVEFMGRMQGPSLMKRGWFADEQVRKRFATAEIPVEGEYVVTARGCKVMLGSAGFSRKPRPVAAAGHSPAATV
jgi:hypothetical protein